MAGHRTCGSSYLRRRFHSDGVMGQGGLAGMPPLKRSLLEPEPEPPGIPEGIPLNIVHTCPTEAHTRQIHAAYRLMRAKYMPRTYHI